MQQQVAALQVPAVQATTAVPQAPVAVQTKGSSTGSSGSVSSSGASGSSIVAYADQFVGNPYVWGGNSLTNGIDCSHFVYQVLKNTGAYKWWLYHICRMERHGYSSFELV